MIHTTIPPITVIQETPKGLRSIGDNCTLLSVTADYGILKPFVNVATPHLIFETAQGNTYNISYFRNTLMRDVAFALITSPYNKPGSTVTLPMKEFFSKWKKTGKREDCVNVLNSLIRLAEQRPKDLQKWNYVHEFQGPILNELWNARAKVALYLFATRNCRISFCTTKYNLDLIIKYSSRYDTTP